MSELTEKGRAAVTEAARRHGFDDEAAEKMLRALARGHGRAAQFNDPAFGGMGQWSQGGMTQIGDMFNDALKGRVSALATDLSEAMAKGTLLEVPPIAQPNPNGEWPAELGQPSSQGSQNDMRYAVFPASRRLAVAEGGKVTIYDTADHKIGGVSQQQSGARTLSFTSQHGPVSLSDLKVVSGEAPKPAAKDEPKADMDIGARLERLADLHKRGLLDDAEYASKKAELVALL